MNRADPEISILINNYNYARFLAETIESALGQSWPADVIVVDDGSTDESPELLRRYADRVTVISQENRGQAAALNAGIARARGAVVMLLDADDRLLPGAVERVAEAWHRQPDLGKVQYRMIEIDANGLPTGRPKPPRYVELLSGDLRRHYLTFPDDVWRMPTSGIAIPARVLAQICPIPEAGYRAGADTYLAHLAPLYGPVVSIEVPGAEYRIHGQNRYVLASSSLNLDRIRRNISHIAMTNRHLSDHARRLGLDLPKGGIGSVSYFVNRTISLKLARARHPIAGDSLPRLAARGSRAALRRFDIGLGMRLAYIAWFISMLVAPKRAATRLATWMVFPETRPLVNRLIRMSGRSRTPKERAS